MAVWRRDGKREDGLDGEGLGGSRGAPFLNGSVRFDVNDVSNFVLSQVCRELDHALLLEVPREGILYSSQPLAHKSIPASSFSSWWPRRLEMLMKA